MEAKPQGLGSIGVTQAERRGIRHVIVTCYTLHFQETQDGSDGIRDLYSFYVVRIIAIC